VGAILLLLLFYGNIAAAAEIVSVQSINIKPYNDALSGFKNDCNCNIKQFVLSEMHDDDIVSRINKTKPDLIVAIGIKALGSIKEIKNTPVVYLMALSPQNIISGNNNIAGVDLLIRPKNQLSALKKIMPHVKTIGLIYDPAFSAEFVKDIRLASRSKDINIIAKEIHEVRDFPSLLINMKEKIDTLWIIPDLTVITPEILEYSFLFSIENNIPLITFSKKYLEMGALISFDIDAYDIGRQAWEISDKILSGADIKHIKRIYARKLHTSINLKIVHNFGIIPVDNMLIKALADNQK
jgi:putative ABC transport system substrate-binding protein